MPQSLSNITIIEVIDHTPKSKIQYKLVYYKIRLVFLATKFGLKILCTMKIGNRY